MRRPAAPFAFFSALISSFFLSACGAEEPIATTKPVGTTPARTTPTFAEAKLPDTTQGLTTLVASWKAAHAAKDEAKLKKLAHDMIPTTADLKRVLVEGPATDDFLSKFPAKDMKADDPMIAAFAGSLFKPSPEQSEVQVHAATTADLVEYKEGSVARAEFVPGMQKFAALAKPKVTWYVVELLEPGKDLGMKFACFANVGGRFVFLAKPWRALGGTDK